MHIIKQLSEDEFVIKALDIQKETHSPSSVSECQAAMNIAAVKKLTLKKYDN